MQRDKCVRTQGEDGRLHPRKEASGEPTPPPPGTQTPRPRTRGDRIFALICGLCYVTQAGGHRQATWGPV